MKLFTAAFSIAVAGLPLAHTSYAGEITQTATSQGSFDLKQLKQEDILSDAQLDNFKLEGRWIGPTWWANRMADWGKNGDKDEILCAPNRPFLGWRIAADMTRNIDLTKGDLDVSVNASMMAKGNTGNKLAKDSLVGLLIGSGHSLKNPKSRALIFDFAVATKGKNKTAPVGAVPAVPGSGYAVGISGDGHLKIIDLDAFL